MQNVSNVPVGTFKRFASSFMSGKNCLSVPVGTSGQLCGRQPGDGWNLMRRLETSSTFRLEHCDECSNRNISPKGSSRNIVLNVPVGTLGKFCGWYGQTNCQI